MTQLCAICISFLKGETNSIMTAFKKFNCTNLPREIGRSVIRKFKVEIQKVPVKFTSQYGHKGEYYNYTLLKTRTNKEGRERMKQYCLKQLSNPKTQKELDLFKQITLL